jgi:hypothetical protein
MATSSSRVADPEQRAALASAEEALEAGDYTRAVHTALAVYTRLVERRPDLIAPFVDLRGQFPKPGEGLAPRQRPGGPPPWPELGVGLSQDEQGKPHFEFRKQRFGMSEAIVYVEYVLELVLRAQEGRPT